jgi:hypothetical protein
VNNKRFAPQAVTFIYLLNATKAYWYTVLRSLFIS